MRPRVRDVSFLYMAILAASGGMLAIVASIGIPIWMSFHGHRYEPAFSLFTCWGIAALGGAYGCYHTYRLTDTPAPPPPRGGLPLPVTTIGLANAPASAERHERRAA